MKTAPLGATGVAVSRIGLGCMPMGTRADQDTSFALLDRYAADGGTFLDTADCYSWWDERGTGGGHSESLLGRWFAARGNRDDVFLATKGSAWMTNLDLVWPPGQEAPNGELVTDSYAGASAPVLRRSLEASLRRLGTDHVDLYYVHVDDRSVPLVETLETLAGFVAEGKIRFYGYSNVRAWRLAQIELLCEQHGWPEPVAVQQEYSYLQRSPGLRHASILDDEQRDYLVEHPGLSLVAYSPVLGGLYDVPAAERESWPSYWPYAGAHTAARLAAVDALATELGVKPSRVVLAWLLAQSAPSAIPLVGTSRVDRYTEQVAALELELSAEQLAALDDA